jgi:LPXTG-motif cell wall-anchored protein
MNGQNGAAAGANAQNAGTSSRADQKQLPQTASPLPLIALAGFGSLALGVLLRRRVVADGSSAK